MSENRQNDPGRSGWKQRSLEGFFGLVGPMWTKREGDSWAYGLVVEAQHTNPAGIIHGGALMTFIDHALSAIAWEAAQRRPCVTVQLDVQFVAAVRPAKLSRRAAASSSAPRAWFSCRATSPWRARKWSRKMQFLR